MDDVAQGGSNINPLALLFLIATVFIIFFSSRRNAVGALLAMAALIPLGQEINVAGLHFYFLRILILVGVCRVFMRHEITGFRLTGFDKLMIAWGLIALVCGLIREPSAEIFGIAYNNLGIYFLFRLLMREDEDVSGYFSIFAVLGCIFGACMLYEDLTRHNPFHIFGGVPEITVIRGDRFRCQGAFRQPILAGSFGASLFPLMVAYWQHAEDRRGRWLAILGGISSMVITVTSASSGPLLTLLAAFAGFAMWPMRQQMRFFRRGVVVTIIALSLVMKAHVWFIIDRISSLTGGGGYYRSDLIDKFVNHFDQWWFIGTSYTANWATAGIVLASNPNMVDITNHYIEQGVSGGLVEFCVFIAMLVICFKIIGRAVWSESDWSYSPRLAWALGVTLACHCTAFISVSYFDQIQVFWFWLLAAIAAIPLQALRKAEEESEAGAESKFDEDRAALGSSI